MGKTMTIQPAHSTQRRGCRTILSRSLSNVKLLPGILLLFALLASACQPIPHTSATTESSAMQAGAPASDGTSAQRTQETEQEQTRPLVDPNTLDMDALLPLDPSIRKATLDNGLTYYIRHNTEPVNRATLMLIVNAGSVQEDDDQLGLAHFLEHMMFNGTERFPKHALIDYLQSIGMSFGSDVNASTSFDETIYFLEFPTDDAEIIRTTFQVAEDWAGHATISDEEVDNERGIILEEERLALQNVGGRLTKQIIPFLLGDSRYTERMVIGDMDIIRNTPADALRRFYRDWYRPDLMAVVVVGDVDVDAMEAMIIEHFSDLSTPETPRPRLSYPVPDHADTRYLIITDPEFPQTFAQIIFRQSFEELTTGAAYRNNLIGWLFYDMLNFRLEDIAREAASPFLWAFVGEDAPVRGVTYRTVSVQVRQGEVLSGLDAILTEIERVRRHGFTAAELEQAKSRLLNAFQRQFNDRENLQSIALAYEYSRNFLMNEAIPGIAFEYRLTERLLPQIARHEVNRRAEQHVGTANRSVLVVAPEREADSLPSQEELAVVIDTVQAKQIDPYADIETVTALLTDIPQPTAIISQQRDEAFDITDLTLANGVRVLLKPTDFQDEEVILSASSPGGSSLVTDEDYPEASTISLIVEQSGISNVSYAALQRLLADQAVSVQPFISELEEGFHGFAGQDSVETLFQLVYLYGTAPHADEDAFATMRDQFTDAFRNRELQPFSELQDALTEARYGKGNTLRYQSFFPLEAFPTFDLERAFAIYQERFADFSDFTFILVGNFDVEQVTEWSQIYLGNLPSLNRTETWQDVAPDPPTGIIAMPVYRGQEAQSLTVIQFTGPADQTQENRLHLRVLDTILNALLREELREERAGVYASYASAGLEPHPDSLYDFTFFFGSSPERAEELTDVLFGLIEGVQTDGPRDDLLEKAKAQILHRREEQLEQNYFWQGALMSYVTEADVELADLLDLEMVKSRVEAVTAADIQAAAVTFLPLDRYILATLYPEDFEN